MHINSPTFGNGNLEENEHQRSNIVVHAFTDFFRRLSLAYQAANEVALLVAGTNPKEAEKALKVIKRLKASPTTVMHAALGEVAETLDNSPVEVEYQEKRYGGVYQGRQLRLKVD